MATWHSKKVYHIIPDLKHDPEISIFIAMVLILGRGHILRQVFQQQKFEKFFTFRLNDLAGPILEKDDISITESKDGKTPLPQVVQG